MNHIIIDNKVISRFNNGLIMRNRDNNQIPKLTLGNKLYDNLILHGFNQGQLLFEDFFNKTKIELYISNRILWYRQKYNFSSLKTPIAYNLFK